jgi:PAS domain S-box-containing protein
MDHRQMKKKRLQKNLKETLMKHIYEISCLLTQSHDLDRVLNEIIDRVVHGLHYDRAIIMLLDAERAKLECRCIRGFTPLGEKRAWEKPLVLDRHDCYETKVVKSGMPLFIPDIENDPDITDVDRITAKHQERKSLLHVPLKVNNIVLGTIGVDRYRTRMEISQDEVEALAIFANQAAVVIENARLYKKLIDEKMLSENIIRSSVNGVIVTDTRGKVHNLNPKAEEILAIRKEESMQLLIEDIFKVDEAEKKAIYRLLKRKETISHKEISCTRRDGKKLVLDFSAFSIVNADQNALNAIIVISDLTEKKKMDDYFLRVEKFAALGHIVSGIAHEIRNPLAGIYTTVQNLEADFDEASSQKIELKNIMSEIDRVEKLIREILNLAKPLPLQVEKVDIHQLLSTTLYFINKEAAKKGIVLETLFNDGIVHIKADPNRLRQVFLNLMINAVESVNKNGKVSIRTEVIKADDGRGGNIIIRFQDDGIGIPLEHMNKIFDPFFTTKNVGTGLGLTVSHKIIQDHCGMIEVESQINKGTTFSITLPLNNNQ